MKDMRNKFKIFTIFVGCLLFRLLPFKAPNVEPLMASVMPLSIKHRAFSSFLFGFLSIFLFDFLTNFGTWTWITAFTYGLVGIAASFYFKNSNGKILNFVAFSFVATIAYDLVTGVLFAPLFNQTIYSALIMQIPFTLLHLASNIGFAVTLSPLISKWLKTSTFFAFEKSYDLRLKKI